MAKNVVVVVSGGLKHVLSNLTWLWFLENKMFHLVNADFHVSWWPQNSFCTDHWTNSHFIENHVLLPIARSCFIEDDKYLITSPSDKPQSQDTRSDYEAQGVHLGPGTWQIDRLWTRLSRQFAWLFSSSLLTFFHKKTKNARLQNPTDFLHKNLMKPLEAVLFWKCYCPGSLILLYAAGVADVTKCFWLAPTFGIVSRAFILFTDAKDKKFTSNYFFVILFLKVHDERQNFHLF